MPSDTSRCFSSPPKEYVQLYDQVEDENKTTTKQVISDVFAEIKRVGDSVSKFDLEKMMETLQERVSVIDSIDTKLELKVKAMETRIMEKLSATLSSLCTPTTTADACECETLKQHLNAKESEISLLQDELKGAEKRVNDIDRKYKDVMLEVKNLRTENVVVVDNLKNSSVSYESLRTKNEEATQKILLFNQEIAKMKTDITDRDKANYLLKKEKGEISNQLNESLTQFKLLNESVQSLLTKEAGNGSGFRTDRVEDDANAEPDIVILHDSIFKAVKPEGLMRREKVKVMMKWAPKLKDALDCVLAMMEKPKVVLLHVGTNDIEHATEEEMLDNVNKIQEILENRGIKLVYSYVIPSDTKAKTAKSEVVNSRVVQKFAASDDVFIGRNDNFYHYGVKSDKLFLEDGIHLNDDGTKALVRQTKEVLCRSLGIEYHNNFNHNNSNRYNNFNNRNRGGRYPPRR